MDMTKTSKDFNLHRRRFFGATAMSIAAGQLGVIGPANAQTAETNLPAIKPGTNTTFAPLKHIDAGLLNVDTPRPAPPMAL
jgi:hypothetical protein